MTLGKLGEQVVIRSRAAFDTLRFIDAESVNSDVFYPKRMSRDRQARNDYLSMLTERPTADAVYISNLINGKSL